MIKVRKNKVMMKKLGFNLILILILIFLYYSLIGEVIKMSFKIIDLKESHLMTPVMVRESFNDPSDG